jgi:hypothetical protein
VAFAEETSVPIERSKQHIEQLLLKAGAQGYHTGWQAASGDDPGWDAIEFLWNGRQIRFRLPRHSVNVTRRDRRGRTMTPAQIDRQRWRVLFLVVKAKIEAVQAGISIFEEEFMAFIVTSSGHTIGEVLLPRIIGNQPLLLGDGK